MQHIGDPGRRTGVSHARAVVAILVLTLVTACTSGADEPARRPADSPVTTSSPAPPVVRSELRPERIGDLAPLDRSSRMPRSIPSIDAPLPTLLDDLPGRAVMVVRPGIATLNAAVRAWSDITLLFYGADGRWRRLSMDELGLPPSLRYQDTFGSGSLSSDGLWWAGPSARGLIALNLTTGATHVVPVRGGVGSFTWVPGGHTVLTNGWTTAVPGGAAARVPYPASGVGFEPDGRPLSILRGSGGRPVLVEWRGRDRHPVTVVDGLSAPARRISRSRAGVIASSALRGVGATVGRVAGVEIGEDDDFSVVVADSTTGRKVGELTWTGPKVPLAYVSWLDEDTVLIATVPQFVAWRPATGELFRVTDARRIDRSAYWQVAIASGQANQSGA